MQPTKTFDELRDTLASRDASRLEGLGRMDLNVLLSLMNRLRVPLSEEEGFSRFYLEVIDRVRKGRV